MVTGDQLAIGIETAKRLGMGKLKAVNLILCSYLIFSCSAPLVSLNVSPHCFRCFAGTDFIEGKELMRDDLSDVELGQKILQVAGFAGVYPEHKHRIVQALQARGMLVGMTGMPSPVYCAYKLSELLLAQTLAAPTY